MSDGRHGARASVLLMVVLLLAVAAPVTAGQWYRLCSTQTQGDFLRDIRFADSLRGWMVGRYSVYSTADRGRTWSVDYTVPSDPDTSYGVFGLAAVDTANVYISDYRNYYGQGHIPPPVSDVYVRRRYPTGNWQQLLYLHFEGGGQWVAAGRLFFLDTLHGWHLGSALSHGDARRTVDGGGTWEPFQKIAYGDWDAWFVDSLTGWAASGSIRKTTNAGDSWVVQLTGEVATRVRMLDSLRGWVLTLAGMLRTSDGGDTWQHVLTQDSFGTMWFCDSMNGVCAGSRGRVLRTTDGGTTWLPDTTGVTWNIRSVFMLDSTHAWAVGDSGIVLGYGDWAVPGIEESGHGLRVPSLSAVWPNPCRGTLWARWQGGDGAVVIYNDCGRPVASVQCSSASEQKLDLRRLPTGVYFVCASSSPQVGVRFVLLR